MVITDKESGLMLLIFLVFNQSCHVLCKRHIDQNIFVKLTLKIGKDAAELFVNTTWCRLINSDNEKDYNERLENLKTR